MVDDTQHSIRQPSPPGKPLSTAAKSPRNYSSRIVTVGIQLFVDLPCTKPRLEKCTMPCSARGYLCQYNSISMTQNVLPKPQCRSAVASHRSMLLYHQTVLPSGGTSETVLQRHALFFKTSTASRSRKRIHVSITTRTRTTITSVCHHSVLIALPLHFKQGCQISTLPRAVLDRKIWKRARESLKWYCEGTQFLWRKSPGPAALL